jgi:hypothetical protein
MDPFIYVYSYIWTHYGSIHIRVGAGAGAAAGAATAATATAAVWGSKAFWLKPSVRVEALLGTRWPPKKIGSNADFVSALSNMSKVVAKSASTAQAMTATVVPLSCESVARKSTPRQNGRNSSQVCYFLATKMLGTLRSMLTKGGIRGLINPP